MKDRERSRFCSQHPKKVLRPTAQATPKNAFRTKRGS